MTLSAQRETQIADEEIQRSLEDENRLVRELSKEGLIGDVHLPAPERLDRYWLLTPNLTDVPLLAAAAEFPQIEELMRSGEAPMPVNPHWQNLMREPGLFTEQAKDFIRLNAQYEGRYDQ